MTNYIIAAFFIGVIAGMIVGVYIAPAKEVYNIKKLKTKGDNSPITSDLDLTKKRRKLRLFKRKNKENGNN
jgi:gas vesicle protein